MHYAEPYRAKIVERIAPTSPDQRLEALRAAGWNVHNLPHRAVYLDLGSAAAAAMSDRQWSALMLGDEAYAGSENFYELERAVRARLGLDWVVPTHSGRGAENLLLRHLVRPGQLVLSNKSITTLRPLAEDQDARVIDVCGTERGLFAGDFDLHRLDRALKLDRVALVVATASVPLLGGRVLSLKNLEIVSRLCRSRAVPLVLDATRLGSAAYFLREMEELSETVDSLMRRYAALADLVYLSGREDACCQTGGLIAGQELEHLASLRELVVLYEGLHTYGGQAGRDMQALAQGLLDMGDLAYHHFRRRKLDFLVRALRERDLPVEGTAGTDGVALQATGLVKGRGCRAAALAASLYLASGVRAGVPGSFFPEEAPDLLLLRVPRRVYTEMQLTYAVEALAEACARARKGLRPLERAGESCFRAPRQMPVLDPPQGTAGHPRPEPFVHKVVEPMAQGDRERRLEVLERAGYNTFLIPSREVYVDLLTDSGTSAMSSEQWARMIAAREGEGRTPALENLEHAVREVLGFRFVLPAHQGRAAEHILSRTLIRPGQLVVNNLYFTTTREHQERAGGVFVDLIRQEAMEPGSVHPFKGDLDPDRLERLIKAEGPERIAYVCLETNVNMAGGHPVSLAGTRRVSEIARYYRIPFYFDATRVAENAYFIKTRESGCGNKSIGEIVRELMSLGDGCTISAKKDLLVNIGGLLATNDAEVFERCSRLASVYIAHGGVAARDLAAMAQGLYEVTELDYLRNRIEQVQYLGRLLQERGIPIVLPVGGHAVFLDARAFLSHLPQSQFPAQRLAAELYLEAGVRSMERGLVSAGRDHKTGLDHESPLELVRLTVPRRVYTFSHMEVVADAVERVWQRRHQIEGLEMIYEPASLRFFQARFRPASVPLDRRARAESAD